MLARLFTDARTSVRRRMEERSIVCFPGMSGFCYRVVHAGYVTWEEYETNQRRLRENAQALGHDRRKSPPREGPALLQGLVLCGLCGNRMTVRYHDRAGSRVPDYVVSGRVSSMGNPCANVYRENRSIKHQRCTG